MYSVTRYKNQLVNPLILTVILLALGCSTTSFKESLHTTLELKELNAKFTLVNGTSETQVLNFTSGCQYGYTLEANNEVILHSATGCIAVMTDIVLNPLDKKEFEFSLKYKGDLAPGTYKLKAYIIGKDELSNELIFEVEE
ncbi:MAG: BsuPI-related putative proteinase inhibitor [Balneolaceae bacterium]